MGKKPQRQSWPEAKKRCRLNQSDIEMAKRLGFGPDSLIRAVPDPKQKWKLPVKYWVRDLYERRFGEVLGSKPEPLPARPATPEYDEEAVLIYGEQLYWENYWDRNRDDPRSSGKNATRPQAAASQPRPVEDFSQGITDDDVPF